MGKASREQANLTEIKNLHTPVYGVKEFVCHYKLLGISCLLSMGIKIAILPFYEILDLQKLHTFQIFLHHWQLRLCLSALFTMFASKNGELVYLNSVFLG